jgi:LPS sulfotransferase NodH
VTPPGPEPPSGDARPPVDAYFVCATPRTGSSLLLGLLESTGVAGRPEAYFREPDEQLWAHRWGIPRGPDGAFDYGDFVDAARRAGTTGNGVFGAKLMWGTLDRLAGGLGTVHPELAGQDLTLLHRAFGRLRFVFLRRGDVLRQAVSWLRAEQTGTWFVGDPGGSGGAPSFDADGIRSFVRTVEEHNAAWEAWFAAQGVEPHRLMYEDLAADMAAATRGVLEHLGIGLPPGRGITARHRRQADDLSEEWVRRYRTTSTER